MNRNKIGKIVLSFILSIVSLWYACDLTVNLQDTTLHLFLFFILWGAVCGFITWLVVEICE